MEHCGRAGALIGAILLASCGGEQTRWRPPTGDALSPEVYRPQIVEIDRIVFQDGPIAAAGQDDLRASINDLADRIDSVHPSPLVTALNHDLRRLGQMPPRNLPWFQQQWMRIRDGLFNDASWYRRSSSDPVASLHSTEPELPTLGHPARPLTPEANQLKRAMYDLQVQVTNVRSSPRDTADALRWNEKLDAIANEMPDAASDPSYAKAIQRTRDAILLARQKRLDESSACLDTAFTFFAETARRVE